MLILAELEKSSMVRRTYAKYFMPKGTEVILFAVSLFYKYLVTMGLRTENLLVPEGRNICS